MQQKDKDKDAQLKRAVKQVNSLKFITDTFLVSIPPLVQKGGALILLPIITSQLGTSLYGIWQQFNTTSKLLLQFCTFTNPGQKKYLSQVKDKATVSAELTSVSLFVLILGILVGSIFIFFNDTVAVLIFSDTKWKHLISYLGLYIVLEAMLNSFTSFFQSQRFTKAIAVINSSRKIAILCSIATVTFLFRSVEAVILTVIIIEGISLIGVIYFVYVKKHYRFIVSQKEAIYKYLRFGLPLLFSSLGNWVGVVIDRYFILYFLGISAVGVYAGSYLLGSLIIFFIRPLVQMLLPDLSKLYSLGQHQKIQLRISTVIKYYLGLGLIVTIIIMGFGDTILISLSSKDFTAGILPMKIISIGIFFYGLMQILTKCLSALMDTSYFGLLWVVVAVINVISNLILIPAYALDGAAASTLIAYSLGSGFLLILLGKKVAITNTLLKDVARIGLGGIMAGIVVFLLMDIVNNYFFLTLLASGLAFLTYAFTLKWSGFLTPEEIGLFQRVKKKAASKKESLSTQLKHNDK